MRLIKLLDTNKYHRLADGCVLPDGQLAVAWFGEYKTHGTYPSLEAFKLLQLNIPNRAVEDYKLTHDEMCFGIYTYTQPVTPHKVPFSGSRIKRGLYKTSSGRLINADTNGSMNTARKVIPDVYEGIGALPFVPVVDQPLRTTDLQGRFVQV